MSTTNRVESCQAQWITRRPPDWSIGTGQTRKHWILGWTSWRSLRAFECVTVPRVMVYPPQCIRLANSHIHIYVSQDLLFRCDITCLCFRGALFEFRTSAQPSAVKWSSGPLTGRRESPQCKLAAQHFGDKSPVSIFLLASGTDSRTLIRAIPRAFPYFRSNAVCYAMYRYNVQPFIRRLWPFFASFSSHETPFAQRISAFVVQRPRHLEQCLPQRRPRQRTPNGDRLLNELFISERRVHLLRPDVSARAWNDGRIREGRTMISSATRHPVSATASHM
jgi:hypothetical protein